MPDDPHDQMHERPTGPPWRIPVLTREGEATRFIVITIEDGREVWSTPKYPFIFPRESKAPLLSAVVEADAAAYGNLS